MVESTERLKDQSSTFHKFAKKQKCMEKRRNLFWTLVLLITCLVRKSPKTPPLHLIHQMCRESSVWPKARLKYLSGQSIAHHLSLISQTTLFLTSQHAWSDLKKKTKLHGSLFVRVYRFLLEALWVSSCWSSTHKTNNNWQNRQRETRRSPTHCNKQQTIYYYYY